MKKILRYALLSAVAMFSTAAMAQTTVGATDNTTGYMGAYSEELQLTDGQVATFEFTNYTAGAENYQNWVTCVSNGTCRQLGQRAGQQCRRYKQLQLGYV